jgi:signal transduction histidine kinase
MRRRLTSVAGILLGLLLVALMAPLGSAYAEDRTQDAFVQRLTDVTRFAVLAQDALEGGGEDALAADLERYAEVYGGTVLVTNENRELVAASDESASLADETVASAIEQALSGRGSSQPTTVWPWVSEPFVVSSPVGRDAQVLGAVVLIAPTDPVRSDVGVRLAWLVAAALAVLLLFAFGLVGRFVAWILRPVVDLDVAAVRMAQGDLDTRVPATAGPPELRHLTRSFNQMADHVQASQHQQRALIADASHQLGNPLTALRLRLDNLRSAPSPAEADLALEEADRLSDIVESLLDLSQVDAHEPSVTPVDVAELVRRRCEMWAPVLPDLELSIDGDAVASATPDLVDVVLDALLDNAAKFAPGSPLSVSVSGTGADVSVAVRDHGPGLHQDDVDKVGARFFRGREHQNVSGTGLGLAIVRARVEAVGGSFEVSRPVGGGLRVEVRLPRVRPAVP